ncbi:MAG TPA: tRNA (adenosine(37)-N6)-dimethylallyltransferase MiaA [Candidatus Paceibacterota bacterium]|nr:tRNA (adenosine(37)-N6)-dimethylallyltransferase MiaA [Candidatus Paceibacterota bacterium]
MSKVIVILGQTAIGKSDFAVEVAHQINGEIISADSRQVYKGMNIGTGKITKKEMLGVPHHLLDVTSPSKVFSVSDFQKIAFKKIGEIAKKGKVPIVCGGTGFYIDAIVNNTTFPEVPPNKKIRETLSKKTTEQLFEMLKKLDPTRAKTIDKNNKVRLIRAIEIAKSLGKVPSIKNSSKQHFGEPSSFLKIGLKVPPEILKERILLRLFARMKKGMVYEVEKLHRKGLSWKRMYSLGLEYKYVALYLQKKITKEEMLKKLNAEIWHFAKRQNTWFKRDKSIIWIDPREKNDKLKALKEIKEFLLENKADL